MYLLQLHTHLQASNQATWTRRIAALHSSFWDLDLHRVSFCPFFCNVKIGLVIEEYELSTFKEYQVLRSKTKALILRLVIKVTLS